MKTSSYIYYRLPDKAEIYRKAIKGFSRINWADLDLSKHKGFIMSSFSIDKNIILFSVGSKEPVLGKSIQHKIFPKEHNFHSFKEKYKTNVEEAVTAIKTTNLEKVVLAQNFTLTHKVDCLDLFYRMCSLYPHGFIYYLAIEDIEWIGASPEMLCRYANGIGETVALAGTQDKKGKDWGSKEKEEQGFIQSYIEEEFSKIDDFEFKKGNTRTIRAGDIEHISSLYNFKTNLNGLNALVKQLHPTPAVCGYPKKEAQELIATKESFDREYYSGFLGLNEEEETNLFVNLRCAKIKGKEITLFAGAGITKDSIPEKEWEEVLKKIATILNV